MLGAAFSALIVPLSLLLLHVAAIDKGVAWTPYQLHSAQGWHPDQMLKVPTCPSSKSSVSGPTSPRPQPPRATLFTFYL
jgi:hypothetical protein